MMHKDQVEQRKKQIKKLYKEAGIIKVNGKIQAIPRKNSKKAFLQEHHPEFSDPFHLLPKEKKSRSFNHRFYKGRAHA